MIGIEVAKSRMEEVDMTVRKAKEMEIISHLRDEGLWINTEMASTSVAKLNNLFKELDAFGDNSSTTPTTTESHHETVLNNLNSWIESFSPTEVNESKKWKFGASQSHEGGTGVYATSSIAKGEDVIVVPSEVMLSAKFGEGRHSDIGQLLNTMADNSALELACTLAYHKMQGNASFFAPYINALPTTYTVPVYWDESVWESIRNTRTIGRALQTLRATASLYFRALNMVRIYKHTSFPYTKFSWELFKWSMSTVITRQNQVVMTAPNPQNNNEMVPVGMYCSLAMSLPVTSFFSLLLLFNYDSDDSDDEYTNLLQSLLSVLSIHIFFTFHLLLLLLPSLYPCCNLTLYHLFVNYFPNPRCHGTHSWVGYDEP